jgi:Tfp pilus assembly major pilin PilA
MIKYIKKQAGSMVAEVAAIIAAIGILTLIGTSYYSLVVAKAQMTEGFVIAQPLINQVNNFYAGGGVIGTNYLANEIYDNSDAASAVNDRAGRYIQSAVTYANGVVHITFNPNMTIGSDQEEGAVGNVHAILASKSIIFVPFYAVETVANPAPFLRWSCMTNINNDLASGNVIDTWVTGGAQSNPLNGFAEGCLVVDDTAITNATTIAIHSAPNGWETYPDGAFN